MSPDPERPRLEPRRATSDEASTATAIGVPAGRSAEAPDPRGCRLTEHDVYLFRQGTHYRLYDKLGAHPATLDDRRGVSFAVWAPHAERVSVIGDFNDWKAEAHPLERVGESGIWSGFVEGIGAGAVYKYRIVSRDQGYTVDKADPFAFRAELSPRTASVVWELDHSWDDEAWRRERERQSDAARPMAIYELHLGSWRRREGRWLGYRELADELIPHLARMSFTHVELLPVMEHPFYGSWGYQTTGYFAPTSRFGTPQDFMHFVDRLHQAGFGVILDWVPSHFPGDEHGLVYFDGTHLFEHADPRQGFHPDWKSYIYNYGRPEVRSFLISSALFWLERYHGDGLRVDAVASMLYLDYSRKQGEWIPNRHGGRENLEAIEFLRQLNDAVHTHHPGVKTIAEESTAWPMVSRPAHLGGLGFDMKWDMGWMHDTLHYLSLDPIHRRFHHKSLTFRQLYSFAENFVLPLSHDEVVHGKGSLLRKMPGDYWQKFANLRLLYGAMYGQPGKKLLFMGAELAQWKEWNHEDGLDWHLLDYPSHEGLRRWLADLNGLYRDEPALHEQDFAPAGFAWIDCNDQEQSTISFLRQGCDAGATLLVVANFTPVPRYNYRVGVPRGGHWREVLNSDAPAYGGSGQGNLGGVDAAPLPYHGQPWSVSLILPPLAILFFRPEPCVPDAERVPALERTTELTPATKPATNTGRPDDPVTSAEPA